MDLHSDEFLDFDDDDLIEVHVNSSRNLSGLGNLILPRPENAASPRPRPAPASAPAPAPASAPVIDLTEEPDSPVQRRQSPPRQAQPQARNPRRTNSQRISPPRLARSDSTFFGPAPSYIDLTAEDSPEEERPAENRPLRARPRPDELIELEFISSAPRRTVPNFTIGLTRRLAGILGADIVFQQPQLDHSRNAFAPREPSPKPPMEDIGPPREGFTRNTCTEPEKESESVVVCPACEEELAYDPTGTSVSSSTGGGKGKRKRAPGEHHFWALKKCGHVYCADCFENRKPTKMNPSGVGFRFPEGKPIVANELRCAVDDCETRVSTKSEWVGIFL